EPSPETRRTLIGELWSEQGEHVLQPPVEMREMARQLGFAEPRLELRGYPALETRVKRAYEDFVAAGQYVFRAQRNAERLRDHIKFNWEMVSTNDGSVAAVGLNILVLDDQDRIRLDCTFIEP
ncbi:MAG TPA: hypothetical protein VFG86_00510, partial [Chloroflexota bacterium]|nr:hypothetical protein [Chloroflexota bacterium]